MNDLNKIVCVCTCLKKPHDPTEAEKSNYKNKSFSVLKHSKSCALKLSNALTFIECIREKSCSFWEGFPTQHFFLKSLLERFPSTKELNSINLSQSGILGESTSFSTLVQWVSCSRMMSAPNCRAR